MGIEIMKKLPSWPLLVVQPAGTKKSVKCVHAQIQPTLRAEYTRTSHLRVAPGAEERPEKSTMGIKISIDKKIS